LLSLNHHHHHHHQQPSLLPTSLESELFELLDTVVATFGYLYLTRKQSCDWNHHEERFQNYIKKVICYQLKSELMGTKEGLSMFQEEWSRSQIMRVSKII
jgi:hypothetical protein